MTRGRYFEGFWGLDPHAVGEFVKTLTGAAASVFVDTVLANMSHQQHARDMTQSMLNAIFTALMRNDVMMEVTQNTLLAKVSNAKATYNVMPVEHPGLVAVPYGPGYGNFVPVHTAAPVDGEASVHLQGLRDMVMSRHFFLFWAVDLDTLKEFLASLSLDDFVAFLASVMDHDLPRAELYHALDVAEAVLGELYNRVDQYDFDAVWTPWVEALAQMRADIYEYAEYA